MYGYRRLLTCLAITIMLLLVVAISPAQAEKKGYSVAVSYFDNSSGQKSFDYLSKGLADMLITDLSKISSLHVVEREKLELLLKEIKLSKSAYFDKRAEQQLGKGLSAGYLLTGSFILVGSDLRIDARLLHVESGKVMMADSVIGVRQDFFKMEKRLAEKIIANLKVKPKREEQVALLALETSSLDAFEKYSTGLDLLDAKNFEGAQKQFKESLQLDDGFVSARSALENAVKLLQKDMETVKDQTKKLDVRTGKLESVLSDISNKFGILSKSGMLISNPLRPEEYYLNATLYQERGDSVNARISFLSYLHAQREYTDPLDRFTRMLIAMEGRSGAAETLRSIRADYPSLPLEIFISSLKEPRMAAIALKDIAKAHPEYGPIYYILAEQFSETRLGDRSLEDKKMERAYLKSFLDTHKKEGVLKYFVDQRLASEWIEKAEVRLVQGANLDNMDRQKTVAFNVMRSNSGWLLYASLAEPATKILYREKRNGQFIDNGFETFIDPSTGVNRPSGQFFLDKGSDLVDFELCYIDVSGVQQGPFKLSAEYSTPESAQAVTDKYILGITRNNWVQFREFDNKLLLYFSHLATYRCAIKSVMYGFNGSPDTKFDLAPCDTKNPYSYTDKTYINVAANIQSVVVQLHYYDGTTSEIRTLLRADHF